MALMTPQSVSLDLQLWLCRTSRTRRLAILLVAISLAVQFGYRPRLLDEQRQAERSMLAISAASGRPVGPTLLQQRQQAFVTRLAAPADRAALLKTLFERAGNAGLTLAQADYQWQASAAGQYDRLQIALPVSGSYPQLRAFLADLLEHLPAAAVDAFELHRDSVAAASVTANLTLSIYFREGP